MQGRAARLCDAGIEVLARGGGRKLTHRAVDTEAGLPVGSTSNLFRSRDALLAGILQRILDRETAVWQRAADDVAEDLVGIDGFATAWGRLVEDLTGEHRVLTLARHVVFVEASSRQPLRQEIERARGDVASWVVPALVRLGSDDPDTHLYALLALVDGMLASRLADPSSDLDPSSAVGALLRGLLGRAAT